jgi:hypothetical protein
VGGQGRVWEVWGDKEESFKIIPACQCLYIPPFSTKKVGFSHNEKTKKDDFDDINAIRKNPLVARSQI